MGVEFGVLIPTREAVMSGRPQTAPLLAMAERAEAAGFDSVWIGDSLVARPRHEPLTLLAAVAARTRRVRLGTAVLLPALRNPVVLAHVVGTLDRVAEGRVILGVGIAADTPAIRKEFEAVGVPFERRVGRFLETLEICRALWSRDHVSFSGKHFPKIREAARAAGRKPDAVTGAAYITLALDASPAAAEQRLHRFLETYYAAPARALLARQACYAGPIEGCVEWLQRWVDAGARHINLRFAGGDQLAQVDEAASRLLPRLKRG